MTHSITLNLTQALQMVAIAPCMLVIFYLVATARQKELAVVPALYFVALTCGLLYYLLPAFIDSEQHQSVFLVLQLGDVLIPAISFLLIFQFMLNRLPPLIYWSVLAVPAIATVPFIYWMMDTPQLCWGGDIDVCFQSDAVFHLNNIIISAFIFILLILIVGRKSGEIVGDQALREYKYWLVMSLIIYNVVLLAINLSLIAGGIDLAQYVFGRTMVKIAFIYMVMTSIFRVFTDLFDMKHVKIHLTKTTLTAYEQVLVGKVEKLLEVEKVYREQGFSRSTLSERLGVGEHLLSRIINLEFKKSFSDLANEYRIREAKDLLAKNSLPVTSVAFDVGFNSIASFNRVFKAMTGKSPSEYREDMQRNII